MNPTFPQTARSTASRDRGRTTYERATANGIIDEAYLCHLGFVVDGEPRVLPTLQVRVGDTLYLHGSTGSGPLLAARKPPGLAVCVTITHLDGVVFARSQAHHSANYRSVVAHGTATLVTDEDEKRRVLTALLDKVAAGRADDCRAPSRKELAETAMLALPLTEASVKARTGEPIDDEADVDLPYWAGVVPLRLVAGPAESASGVSVPVPSYLDSGRSAWTTATTLRGNHVVLEPLDMSHVEGLFAAITDEEVFRWMLPTACPTTVDEMAGLVREALRMYGRGTRIPLVQRLAGTGEIVGSTSYYAPDEVNRAIAIGYSMLGPKWWRTGVNTESKLLMLGHAFDDLGAVRVELHTDIRNERSQRAIERLGATREGVLRRHRRRPDGTWRVTVTYALTDLDWPAARDRLRDRLRPAPTGG
jgi:RimJ/RimL family protein N-acetyltransferase/nitroimidazol reductase NimA-like FMN-containing flavoprotein (pyridoxamine 5'-phosphate oxidase superfamily)